jgi:glutathionylspermidine synthase
LDVVDFVVDNPDLLDVFRIPTHMRDMVKDSWHRRDFTVFGRFDLMFDGKNAVKLLEYNADTPTTLPEAALVQHLWQRDLFPHASQFNDIEPQLLAAWRAADIAPDTTVTFAALHGHVEDTDNARYMQQLAARAGHRTAYTPVQDIGWDGGRNVFVDADGAAMQCCWKLYPWEWLASEQFGSYVPHVRSELWLHVVISCAVDADFLLLLS